MSLTFIIITGFILVSLILIFFIIKYKNKKKEKKNLDNSDGPPEDIYPLF